MTRQLEAVREDRQARRDRALIRALEYGLVDAVQHTGAVLSGFSVKIQPGDCLLMLKAVLAGRKQIAFVGAESLTEVLLKACRQGGRDKLQWRDDKF